MAIPQHLESLSRKLAPLASLPYQTAGIVNATRESYILPEELLDEADDAIERLLGTNVPSNIRLRCERLRRLITEAAGALGDVQENAEVVGDSRWKKLRIYALDCLRTWGFDLYSWELENVS